MKEYIVQAISQETIDSFDAHNAPELVRCKDCMFGMPAKFESGKDAIWCLGAVHEPEWFCADAVRGTHMGSIITGFIM